MLKKILPILIMTMMLFSVPSVAFAENQTDDSSNSVDVGVTSDVEVDNGGDTQVDGSSNSALEEESESDNNNDSEQEDSNQTEVDNENETEVEDSNQTEMDNENENEVENETETEDDETKVEITSNSKARIHLLKLERGIEVRIKSGQFLVEYFDSNNHSSEVDMDLLNSLIDQLEAVNLEIQSLDLNGNTSVIDEAQLLHEDAVSIVSQFRTEARKASLTLDEKKVLLDEFKSIKEEVFADYKQKEGKRLEKFARAHNEEIVSAIFAYIGENRPDLLEKIKSGKVDINRVKEEVKKRFAALPPEKKLQIAKRIKAATEKKKTEFREKRDKVKDKLSREKNNRIKERVKKHKSEIKEKIEKKESEMRDRFEKHKSEIREKIEKRESEIRTKVKEHRSEIKGKLKERKSDIRARVKEKRDVKNDHTSSNVEVDHNE